jgi:hypothetical protein
MVKLKYDVLRRTDSSANIEYHLLAHITSIPEKKRKRVIFSSPPSTFSSVLSPIPLKPLKKAIGKKTSNTNMPRLNSSPGSICVATNRKTRKM